MDLDVNIVIVNYNLTEEIRRLIKSIYKNTYDIKFLINVVDNNSTDKSIRNLEKEFPNVHFYYLDKNYGFAVANNYILKKVKCKYHLVINPDTELIENSIKKLFEFMEQNSDVGILGPQIQLLNERIQYSCFSFPNLLYYLADIFHMLDYWLKIELKIKSMLNKAEYLEADYVLGACMFMREKAIKSLEYFDEEYFLFAEEADLCMRLKKENKYKVAFWSGTTIQHSRSAITNKDKSQRIKWLFESQLLFITKHYSKAYRLIIRYLIIVLMFKNIFLVTIKKRENKEKYIKVYKYLIKYYLKGIPVINNVTLRVPDNDK